MLVNLDIDPNEMITVPTDIWTKRYKPSVCVCVCLCASGFLFILKKSVHVSPLSTAR